MANSGYCDDVCQGLVHELYPPISNDLYECTEPTYIVPFAANIAKTIWEGNSSTWRVNISMITMINLNVMTSRNGPIVSIAMHFIRFRVEVINLDARMIEFWISSRHFLTCDTALDILTIILT